ncbi:MAG TPA: alpha/beta fold hydrolase BchO [Beijerinckiaceae bacterium]
MTEPRQQDSREARPSGDGLDWSVEGRDWPNREASRFVTAGGLRWHVQVMGQGPALLLLHGTGAATHSWRDLAPILAERFTVCAPDLPGHGFTDAAPPGRATLPGLAQAVAALCAKLDVAPALAVGHSAGAAILLRMALDGLVAPRGIVALNGALLPFRGVAGQIFSPLAKLLVWNPLVPRLFAWGAGSPASVGRLVSDTGSTLDPRGVEFYGRLLRHPSHVEGALRMMAHWNLDELQRDLPRLAAPLLLVVGSGDRAVPPSEADRLRAIMPAARVTVLRGLGHLAHEEKPAEVAERIVGFATEQGVA